MRHRITISPKFDRRALPAELQLGSLLVPGYELLARPIIADLRISGLNLAAQASSLAVFCSGAEYAWSAASGPGGHFVGRGLCLGRN